MAHTDAHRLFEQRQREAAEAAVGASPSTPAERFKQKIAPSEFGWVDTVQKTILSDFLAWGDAQGLSRNLLSFEFAQIMPRMWDAIATDLFEFSLRQDLETNRFLELNNEPPGFIRRTSYWTTTTVGMTQLIDWARNWFGAAMGVKLSAGRSGSGARGARGPTAEDIRNQFDVKELSEQINILNRALVLEEHDNPLALAREYVDVVVSTLGEKKVDFETFVRERIEGTSRYKSIYRNKPDHVSAELFMAPYFRTAMGFARPDEAAEIAIGGAQFGASAEDFQQRLRRTDTVTGSSAFINQLEGRLTNLNSVLKG